MPESKTLRIAEACEVPFIEQLRSVPSDYRATYATQWSEDGRETGHRMVPVGHMMHQAADELEAARQEIADQRAEIVEWQQTVAAKDKEIARLRLPSDETLSAHPGCCFCMSADTSVRPGQVCPDCGDRLPTKREYEADRMEQEIADQNKALTYLNKHNAMLCDAMGLERASAEALRQEIAALRERCESSVSDRSFREYARSALKGK